MGLWCRKPGPVPALGRHLALRGAGGQLSQTLLCPCGHRVGGDATMTHSTGRGEAEPGRRASQMAGTGRDARPPAGGPQDGQKRNSGLPAGYRLSPERMREPLSRVPWQARDSVSHRRLHPNDAEHRGREGGREEVEREGRGSHFIPQVPVFHPDCNGNSSRAWRGDGRAGAQGRP